MSLLCRAAYAIALAPRGRGASAEEEAVGSDRHQHPAPVVSERIGMEPPRCRHDRVTDWMAANNVDALVAGGADLVTWDHVRKLWSVQQKARDRGGRNSRWPDLLAVCH